MTICVAWITNGHAYLVADSAVTKRASNSDERSHFGELHASHNGIYVEESALKIFRSANVAVSFSGDAELATEIFRAYTGFARYYHPVSALKRAWSTVSPIAPDRATIALMVFYDCNQPRIVKINVAGETEFAIGVAVIGAVTDAERQNISLTIDSLATASHAATDVLGLGLISLQQFGVFSNLLDRGIGGHYAGVTVGVNGLNWMPPILHVIFDGPGPRSTEKGIPDIVAVFANDDMIFVANNVGQKWDVFANYLGEDLASDAAYICAKAEASVAGVSIDSLAIQMLAIYDARASSVVVVLVDGMRKSPHCFPRCEIVGGKTRFVVSFSEELFHILSRKRTRREICIVNSRVDHLE